MASTTFSGPVTATNGFITGSGSLVTLDSATATATAADHAGRTLLLDRAAGVTVTLPAATGTGNTYKFFVATTVTSNAYIVQVANATDTMAGMAIVANDGGNTASIFETVAASDTITMNGSTTGGILGATIEVQDVASGVWATTVRTAATGSEATPFSAAVS
jgi:hypothetical protein